MLVGLLVPRPALAEPDHGQVDVVLVMDSSGSMRKNDPHRLRVPAAKMLMSLLGTDDRVGLVSFSDDGYPVLHLTPAGDAHRRRLFHAADRVSSKGAYTNLYAAVAKGEALLESEGRADTRKILVLMSDGKMDVGDHSRDGLLDRRLRHVLLPRLKKQHIQVYTIAFTAASDTALMKKIAASTEGLFQLARSDHDLQSVFGTIFESAKRPDMLPIKGGRFLVDAAVKEVTIVASKASADAHIALKTPGGRDLTAASAGPHVRWFVSPGFDMITLPEPEAGSWQIVASKGGDKAYVVTNMGLQTDLKQHAHIGPDKPTLVDAWLSRKGAVIKTPALLANTRFTVEATAPGGTVTRRTLMDIGENGDKAGHDGVFSRSLDLAKPGLHKLRIIAKSATFEREKNVVLQVAAPSHPAAPAKASAPQPGADDRTPKPPAPAQSKPPKPAAKKVSGTKPAKPADPPAGAPGPEHSIIAKAVAGFVAVNLVLLLGLLGYVWWRRRSQSAASESAEEDGD